MASYCYTSGICFGLRVDEKIALPVYLRDFKYSDNMKLYVYMPSIKQSSKYYTSDHSYKDFKASFNYKVANLEKHQLSDFVSGIDILIFTLLEKFEFEFKLPELKLLYITYDYFMMLKGSTDFHARGPLLPPAPSAIYTTVVPPLPPLPVTPPAIRRTKSTKHKSRHSKSCTCGQSTKEPDPVDSVERLEYPSGEIEDLDSNYFADSELFSEYENACNEDTSDLSELDLISHMHISGEENQKLDELQSDLKSDYEKLLQNSS